MKKTHNTKYSIKTSIVSLILCFSMLLGTTYAWFTDSVTSSGNIIQSGNLDIGMYWSENNTDWNDAEGANSAPVFSYDNWEPGYTEVRYVKVTNEGSLSFKYQMTISPNGEVENLAEVIDVYYDVVTGNDEFIAPNSVDKQGSLTKVGNLKELISSEDAIAGGVLLPVNELSTDYYSGEIVVCITLHMQEQAGNEYQDKSIGTTFDIKLYATQYDYENDSFDDSYDDEAEWPETPAVGNSASETVDVDDGKVASPTTISGEGMKAEVPAGVKVAQGTDKLTLSVNPVDESEANVTVSGSERLQSLDVHMDGVASDNTVPMSITIIEAMPTGLNLGNFNIYHVENGQTVAMTLLGEGDEIAHNTYSYDPITGAITLHLATFSEIAFVAGEATWAGEYDYSWYEAGKEVYYIANADQLAAFGKVVGGMAEKTTSKGKIEKIEQDSFTGKTVNLVSNIDLGDYENDTNNLLFHPIGYYYTEDKNEDGTKGDYYSTVWSFEGTFNGNGHKIANFYQNTWEIKGDYDDNYYKDAMGLFGYVVNGTVKNLTVDHFSSDGEFTPTGVIAAYATNSTFSNIAITNCNPRVYNTGNGGIVGIGGNDGDPDTYQLTFSNITVDNTNKITALWGSWDVACGGLVGMFRGAGSVKMTNCHVGAQIDVYNDVCGNYQYYWYRYAGMLIGTNKNMITDDAGYTVPETDKFEATGCTVHFGDWNNYYYCELVANSLASYTHDHQFSRLTEIASLSEIKSGNAWLKTGNFLLIEGDNKTCYHIVKDANGNLVEHKHEDAGYEDSIDEDGDGKVDLKEDKQIVYLPFNQLFTGYGWGVKHVPIYNDETANPFKGVTILDRKQADSVEKFEGRRFNREVTADGTVIKQGILMSPISGRHYKLSHIFNYLEDSNVRVIGGAVTVTVTNLDDDGNVTVQLTTRDSENWENSEIMFRGGGRVRLTIQDYYYCTPTSIEVEVRNYPEGSKIRNFTYDGFADDHDYEFNAQADHITNGKHGNYEYDFGYGPEILDYAHKLDSKGMIVFTAPADGIFTVAFASQNVGSGIRYRVKNNANAQYGSYIELDRVDEPYELHVAQINMEKGKTYEFTRVTKECGIYYIGYVPKESIPNDHTHTYYDESTATCTEGGTMVAMCLVCGHKEKAVKVDKLGHDIATEPGYQETCEETGKTAGKYCTRCDYIESGCQSIPAHGHKYVNGFCHCEDEACHRPENIREGSVLAGVDFTTGNANDYAKYGTNSFFKPHGNCDMSNDKKYLIMKTLSTGELSCIEFTVTQDVTFYVRVSSTGRENTSKFVLQDAAGNQIKSVFHDLHHGEHSTPVVEVKGVTGHTIVYTLKAGTYKFYCTSTERVGRVMNMVVSTDVVDVKKVLEGLTPST